MRLDIGSTQIVVVLVVFTFFACKRSGNEKPGLVELKIDTVLVQLPPITSANLIQPTLWQAESNEWFCGYNYLDHSLSIINLTKGEYFKQVKLQENGPDFVDAVNGIDFYGNEKLVLTSLNYITIINFGGKVLDRVRLNNSNSDVLNFDFSQGRLEVSRHSGLQYNPETNEILLGAVSVVGQGLFQKYVAALNLSTKQVSLTKIPDFEASIKGESFGNLNGFLFRRFEKGFIVNPRYSSELALINGESSIYSMNSSITANNANPYNGSSAEYSSITDHQTKSVEFYPVYETYDRSYFFRIHKGPHDKRIQKEPFYMIITDRSFNKILEQPFPENYYIIPLISKGGLMFMAFNKHDDKLELIRYRFNEVG